MADWYIERWIADCVASTSEVLASQPGRFSSDEEGALRAERDLYMAALSFIRTGETKVRDVTSVPPADTIRMIRERLEHSRERARESLSQTEKRDLTEHTVGLRQGVRKIEALQGYLEHYWADIRTGE